MEVIHSLLTWQFDFRFADLTSSNVGFQVFWGLFLMTFSGFQVLESKSYSDTLLNEKCLETLSSITSRKWIFGIKLALKLPEALI